MNYYDEIKNELIKNEINRRVKNYSINRSDLNTYFNVGRMLNEAGKHYGEGIIKEWLMLKFYELREKMQTLSAHLSWSHYCELLSIDNLEEIEYYIKICEQQNLSVRKLREKIRAKEYERLPLDTKNKIVNK